MFRATDYSLPTGISSSSSLVEDSKSTPLVRPSASAESRVESQGLGAPPAKQARPLDGAFVGRSSAREYSTLVDAYGVYASVRNPSGHVYKDVIQAGSAASNGLGSGVPRTSSGQALFDSPFGRVQRVLQQAVEKPGALFVQTTVAVHPWTSEFCLKLRELAPKSLGKATVSVQMTGTDAVFAAVDAARIYASLIGKGPFLLVGESSYHGSGDVGFGDNPKCRSRLGARQSEQILYPCYNPLFDKGEGETEQSYVGRLEKAFQKVIAERGGGDQFSAILIEPVSGSSRVAQQPSLEYIQMLVRVCREHGIVIVADEVMCGLGRIGGRSLWASEKWGLEPDIIVIGKSLGGGALPIAATVIGERVGEAIRESGAHYLHSHTYSGFALGARAGTQALEEFRLIAESGRVDEMGAVLEKLLREGLRDSPHIQIHGEGLMVGGYLLESWAEPKRYSLEVENRVIPILKEQCLLAGVDVYAVKTIHGPGFMCVPPLTIQENEIERLGIQLVVALNKTTEKLNKIQEQQAGDC